MTASRRLIIVRHAKAVAPSTGPSSVEDHDRPLAVRGHRDAPEIGAWIAERVGRVDLVLCSSALRAVQTWELATTRLDAQPPVDVRASLYLIDPGHLLSAVREVGDDVHTLVLVGHEPTQSALTLGLAGDSSDRDALRLLGEGFVTSGVAVLEVPGPWSALQPQGAQLTAFGAPRG